MSAWATFSIDQTHIVSSVGGEISTTWCGSLATAGPTAFPRSPPAKEEVRFIKMNNGPKAAPALKR